MTTSQSTTRTTPWPPSPAEQATEIPTTVPLRHDQHPHDPVAAALLVFAGHNGEDIPRRRS
ncbi:hypothetical protein ACIRQY_35340 [Streptomyces sp. NPDC101490]|uniref:hypothetical protein n=1 Tax=Streptomyces sp. NPDC101490 TaxID=3366143 RepID=UPI003821DC1D